MRVIALIAAQWTMAMLSGQKTSLGGILSEISGQGGSAPTGIPGSLIGAVGGRRGQGGVSIAKIGGGFDDYAPMPKGVGEGSAGGGMMGAASSAMGAFGLAVAANQLIGDIFGFKG